MDEQTDLVSTLVSQHRGLQADLGEVGKILFVERAEEIDRLLRQFAADLGTHLELENGTFYAGLLIKMRAAGYDTSKTEQFMREMDGIAKIVRGFLENYADAERIRSGFDLFKPAFSVLVDTLNLRIESEESGVYQYWNTI